MRFILSSSRGRPPHPFPLHGVEREGVRLTLCVLLQLLGYRRRLSSHCKCRCQYTLPLEQGLALGRQQEIGESDAPGHIFRRIEDSNSIHYGSALRYSICLGILPGNGGIVGCHRRIAQIDLVRQRNVRNIWPLDLVDVEESGVELRVCADEDVREAQLSLDLVY